MPLFHGHRAYLPPHPLFQTPQASLDYRRTMSRLLCGTFRRTALGRATLFAVLLSSLCTCARSFLLPCFRGSVGHDLRRDSACRRQDFTCECPPRAKAVGAWGVCSAEGSGQPGQRRGRQGRGGGGGRGRGRRGGAGQKSTVLKDMGQYNGTSLLILDTGRGPFIRYIDDTSQRAEPELGCPWRRLGCA